MRTLEWRDVNLTGRELCLRPEVSKNKDGRPLPLGGELLEIIQHAHRERRSDCLSCATMRHNRLATFERPGRQHARGRLSGIIVHDLRSTAVRNMVRAGIAERFAMELSGHKTRRVFDRYNIVNDADRARASELLQKQLGTQPSTPNVAAIADRRNRV
jgi:integrase-like protein